MSDQALPAPDPGKPSQWSDCDRIAEVSQSVLAFLVVIGFGAIVLSGNPHMTEVTPFVGLVIGFYFSRQRGNNSKNGGS